MPRRTHEYDLYFDDENREFEAVTFKDENSSDEDTEDASETDMVKQEQEVTDIETQMITDEIASLQKQLKQLEDGEHPDYIKCLKELEDHYQTRQLWIKVYEKVEIERIERDYILEKEAAHKEFEDKKIELRENLISDLEEKKRMIEAERSSMELTSDKSTLQVADHAIARRLILEDSMEVKPVITRKLRRRPNDPLPVPEKRRKTLPTQLNFLLDDEDIMDDLRAISKHKTSSPRKRRDSYVGSSSDHGGTSIEVKVEDGKLYYDKKWYHRGQQVYYEGKEVGSKNSGLISTISSSEIWIKRTSDSIKIRIYISQLQKGEITIRRSA